ncbi:hypothetical protein K501DRAFT_326686, partial [Backusella circina FSU 941]
MNFTVNTFQTVCPGTHLQLDSLAPYVAFMLLSVAFSAMNQPTIVPLLVNEYIDQFDAISDKVKWVEYVRHGVMKSAVLCGTPMVINAEIALYNGLAPEYQSLLRTVPLNQNGNPNVWDSRGKAFFSEVYGDQSKVKLDTIYRADPDLGYYVDEVYGNLISDTTYLSDVETELEVIVTLSMINIIPQLTLTSNVGASPQQIKDAQNIAKTVKQCVSKIK